MSSSPESHNPRPQPGEEISDISTSTWGYDRAQGTVFRWSQLRPPPRRAADRQRWPGAIDWLWRAPRVSPQRDRGLGAHRSHPAHVAISRTVRRCQIATTTRSTLRSKSSKPPALNTACIGWKAVDYASSPGRPRRHRVGRDPVRHTGCGPACGAVLPRPPIMRSAREALELLDRGYLSHSKRAARTAAAVAHRFDGDDPRSRRHARISPRVSSRRRVGRQRVRVAVRDRGDDR